jgi:predicted MFS family arabinose efflux permease
VCRRRGIAVLGDGSADEVALAAAAVPLSILFAGHIDRRQLRATLLLLRVASNLIVATAEGVVRSLFGRVLLAWRAAAFGPSRFARGD